MSEIKNKDKAAHPNWDYDEKGLSKYEWMLGQILNGLMVSFIIGNTLTDDLIDDAFNVCTKVFEELEKREK